MLYLKNKFCFIFSVSEPEEDEVTYIVYTMPRNEAVFLTISENYLRVRDTLTQK